MFGLDGLTSLNMCLMFIVIFVALLFVFIYMALRKIKEGEIPKGDMNTLVPAIDYALRTRGWQSTWNPKQRKFAVTKDSLVATNIYLNQLSDGTIEIRHEASATGLAWIIVVFLLFFYSFGLIVGIVLHVMSRNFAKNEVVPLIMQVSSQPPPYMQYPQVPYYQPPPPIYYPDAK